MPSRAVNLRLCIMMFLEYAVRGMWYPFLANYLSTNRINHGLEFTAAQTGWVLGFAGALGSVTAPLLAGRIADRYLNAEKALAILHCIAGALLFINAASTTFSAFLLIMICFSLAYAPTQSLTNSLALSHLIDPEHNYPRTRMWGTMGWIVSSSLFTYVVLRSPNLSTNVGRIPLAMRTAGALAIVYAAYAWFLLPKTPPADSTPGRLFPIQALRLLRIPSVLVLTLIAVPVSAIHTAYYLNIGPFLASVVGIPLKWVGPTLALAQVSEVVCLFVLGTALKRLGYRAILIFGILAQAVRFVIFAANPPAAIVCVALMLHGVAFACFFTTATLYIERVSPPGIRHSTQMVFGIVLFGLGPALAGPYSEFFDHMQSSAAHLPDYWFIWSTQAAVAAGCAALVAIGFFPTRVGQPGQVVSLNPAAARSIPLEAE
jgi:nucleoside transporter